MDSGDGSNPLVRIERGNGIAVITLSDPEKGNALSVGMAEALLRRVDDAANDSAIRSVLLTAEGRFFCVGGDVRSIGVAGEDVGALLDRITAPLHSAIEMLLYMDKPLVVAVNGPVAGGGLGLAAAGDIVLASDTAHFSMAYAGIGFSPDGAATWLLPRLIGLRRTQELAYTNRRLTSVEAATLGLVTRSVLDADLRCEAREMAEQLARGPLGAFAATRRLLLSSDCASPHAQMELESRSVRAQATGMEGLEGVSAFLERRQPKFRVAAMPDEPADGPIGN
ncbi:MULTISPECIES: enoyl-CoA hydratase/isomerase family protein [unclassified Novosphingobium]|uniref:enoyl-CoA hydratase/isomerase family protein n=1 Tax=unclassified Novosphingobium TaxID=2644732 RepID=UPI000F5FD53F|nr:MULTISPECIES: enoyl-CoA hydratase/isomerase family protein [unclassified Novosphingobium]RQW41737.1 enoyl-CoA hydratase/isomerase family protein [Novosphingobium sp. LASN5T]